MLTSWDYDSQPLGRPLEAPDHRPLLDEAGFDLVAHEDTDARRERQERYGQALLEAAEQLAAESGVRHGRTLGRASPR